MWRRSWNVKPSSSAFLRRARRGWARKEVRAGQGELKHLVEKGGSQWVVSTRAACMERGTSPISNHIAGANLCLGAAGAGLALVHRAGDCRAVKATVYKSRQSSGFAGYGDADPPPWQPNNGASASIPASAIAYFRRCLIEWPTNFTGLHPGMASV